MATLRKIDKMEQKDLQSSFIKSALAGSILDERMNRYAEVYDFLIVIFIA